MPIYNVWDDESRTVTRTVIEGDWLLETMRDCLYELQTMFEMVPHTVHRIVDMSTAGQHVPRQVIGLLRETEVWCDDVGILVVVDPPPLARTMAILARNLHIKGFEELYFTKTLAQARSLIHQYTPADAAD